MIVVASVTPNRGESVISPKEKIDIEMGTKRAGSSGLQLPEILRNLNYDDLEDTVKNMMEEGRPAFDLDLPVEQGSNEPMQSHAGGEGKTTSIQKSATSDGAGESDQSSAAASGFEAVEEAKDENNLHQPNAPVLQA